TVNGILSLECCSVSPAGEYVKRNGLTGEVTIVGFDELPQTLQLIDEGVIAASLSQAPERQSYEAVRLLLDTLNGQAVSDVVTGLALVYQSNLSYSMPSNSFVCGMCGQPAPPSSFDHCHVSDMTSNLAPLSELKDIKKGFPGVQALDGVSLSVYPGEIHAIIGENGAGKSTLMNILAGEMQPDSGDIIFQDRPVRIPHPNVSQQLGISVVYQELALCPNLSVAENISLNTARSAFGLNFVNRRQFAAKARGVLSQLGMDSLELRQPVGRLTVAQQQMVE